MILRQDELKYLKSEELKNIKRLEISISDDKLKENLIRKLIKRNDEDSEELKTVINEYDSISLERLEEEYNILIRYEMDSTIYFNIIKNEYLKILKELIF